MNISSGDTPLVLLCPAWRRWGTARSVKKNTTILHSRADDVVPFADSEKLANRSGAVLVEVGSDHRLADPEPMEACEARTAITVIIEPLLGPGAGKCQTGSGGELTSGPTPSPKQADLDDGGSSAC